MPAKIAPRDIEAAVDSSLIDKIPCKFITNGFPEELRLLWDESMAGGFAEHSVVFYRDPQTLSWMTSEVFTTGQRDAVGPPEQVPRGAITPISVHTHPPGDPGTFSADDLKMSTLVPDWADVYPFPMKAQAVLTRSEADIAQDRMRLHAIVRTAFGDTMPLDRARQILRDRDAIYQRMVDGQLTQRQAKQRLSELWTQMEFHECVDTFQADRIGV